MSELSASNSVNSDLTAIATEEYEPPTVVDVGEAAENILGSFHFDIDADWVTKWT